MRPSVKDVQNQLALLYVAAEKATDPIEARIAITVAEAIKWATLEDANLRSTIVTPVALVKLQTSAMKLTLRARELQQKEKEHHDESGKGPQKLSEGQG